MSEGLLDKREELGMKPGLQRREGEGWGKEFFSGSWSLFSGLRTSPKGQVMGSWKDPSGGECLVLV